MSTLFCFLRHGETLWNREKLIQGRTESPLSPRGREQALSWGPPLGPWKFSYIISSPLGRAQETAALCNRALDLPIVHDDRFIEQDWGNWVGRRIIDIRAQDPSMLAAEEAKGFEFRPQGGESRLEVLARVKDALADIASTHAGQRLLIVSHSGVLRTLAHKLLGSPYTPGMPDPIERGKLLCVSCNGQGLRLHAPAHPLESPSDFDT